jgi:hypothetical protein
MAELPIPHSAPPRHDARQEGSAYIIALLVLVVLTLLGLGLAVITQTEVQIGANELTSHRVLYGVEGGVQLAISKVLTNNASINNVTMAGSELINFVIPETRMTIDSAGLPVVLDPGPTQTHFAEHVEISPFVPIHAACCDGCSCGIGDDPLKNTNHAVVATARRITWIGADQPNAATIAVARQDPTAQKQVYLMVGLSPWWKPKWDPLADEEAVADLDQEHDSSKFPAPTPTP